MLNVATAQILGNEPLQNAMQYGRDFAKLLCGREDSQNLESILFLAGFGFVLSPPRRRVREECAAGFFLDFGGKKV